MKLIRKGIYPPPKNWWEGMVIECPCCRERVQLERGDTDRASICIKLEPNVVEYRCENCHHIFTYDGFRGRLDSNSDKDRLDWLSKTKPTLYHSRHFSGWDIDGKGYFGDLRSAINQAMKGDWP